MGFPFDDEREPVASDDVLRPYWPPGIKQQTIYQVRCDDNPRAHLSVMVAADGDAHLMAYSEDEISGDPSPLPTVRVRTLMGGGHNMRTRQALLWLAEAIRLDAEEYGGSSGATVIDNGEPDQ